MRGFHGQAAFWIGINVLILLGIFVVFTQLGNDDEQSLTQAQPTHEQAIDADHEDVLDKNLFWLSVSTGLLIGVGGAWAIARARREI